MPAKIHEKEFNRKWIQYSENEDKKEIVIKVSEQKEGIYEAIFKIIET